MISLHQGVFRPYAGVKTSVLVFDKPLDKINIADDSYVWFYDIINDGYNPEKISQESRVETPGESDIPELLDLWTEYKNSGFKEPPGIKGLSLLEPGSKLPNNWHINKSVILNNDYLLSANTYKPTVEEFISDEKPEDLIRDLMKIENEVISGLNQLLKDIK